MSETFEVTDAERSDFDRAQAITAAAGQKIADLAAEGKIETAPRNPNLVAFIAPVERNLRKLVQIGKPVSFVDKDSPRGQKMVERDGDIFLEFKEGLVILDRRNDEDQVRIKWCEENPDVCRNARDPMTEAWAAMKMGQQPLNWRDAVLPRSMDVDKALRGDPAGYAQSGSLVDQANKYLDEAEASA